MKTDVDASLGNFCPGVGVQAAASTGATFQPRVSIPLGTRKAIEGNRPYHFTTNKELNFNLGRHNSSRLAAGMDAAR